MNLVSLFDDNLDRVGEQVSLIFEGQSFSNKDLSELGRRLAGGLKSLGYGKGDHIALCLPNIPEIPSIFQAIWRIGAVSVPMMFRLGSSELRYILEHSDAKAIIASGDLAEKIGQASQGLSSISHTIFLDGQPVTGGLDCRQLIQSSPAWQHTENMAAGDPAQIIYTSGTTGRPKGVLHSHTNLKANAEGVWNAWEFDSAPVSLLSLPLAHSFGVSVLTAKTLSPFPECFNVLMKWFNPTEAFGLIERHRVNHFAGVPTMFQMMLEEQSRTKFDLSSLKWCSVGGAPISENLLNAFTREFKCDLYAGYGLTEASPAVSTERPSRPPKAGSCGPANPGVSIKIVDPQGQELPAGEMGEVLVRGANVMEGYYKMPDETAKALAGGWLHTGDIGYLDADGYLFITDRIKDLIIKGGYNVYPKEIEAVLAKHPKVREVAVVGRPDEKYGEQIVAFIAPQPGTHPDEQEIIDHAGSRLTVFKCPAQVYFLDELPKTQSGKISKKELKDRLKAEIA